MLLDANELSDAVTGADFPLLAPPVELVGLDSCRRSGADEGGDDGAADRQHGDDEPDEGRISRTGSSVGARCIGGNVVGCVVVDDAATGSFFFCSDVIGWCRESDVATSVAIVECDGRSVGGIDVVVDVVGTGVATVMVIFCCVDNDGCGSIGISMTERVVANDGDDNDCDDVLDGTGNAIDVVVVAIVVVCCTEGIDFCCGDVIGRIVGVAACGGNAIVSVNGLTILIDRCGDEDEVIGFAVNENDDEVG